MQTLTALCKGQAHSDKEAAGMIDQWASALLLECDQNISSYVLGIYLCAYHSFPFLFFFASQEIKHHLICTVPIPIPFPQVILPVRTPL